MKNAMMFAAALVGAMAAQPVDATVLYSTFGPGNSYLGMHSIAPVAGSSSHWGVFFIEATEFRAPISASLDQIDVALSNRSGSDSALVGIWTKSISGHPGYNLGSWVVTGIPVAGSTSNSPMTITGISGITLAGGADYFVMVSPVNNNDDSENFWNTNSIMAVGRTQLNTGAGWIGGSLWRAPAFDVLGTAVPEPGTIALVLAGLAGAARLRRRRASN